MARVLETGLFWLDRVIGRLELAVGQSPDAIGIESLHPEIYAKCRNLYEGGDYGEAVEKSFRLVGEGFVLLPDTRLDQMPLVRGGFI
jgi:hypothetical protein